jgi:hypothetical protein
MRTALLLAMMLLIAGCAGKPKEPIPLSQVPDNVLKVAKEKLPDVTFERAMKKPNGEYEVIGKNKTGKVREVEVTPTGEVTAVE